MTTNISAILVAMRAVCFFSSLFTAAVFTPLLGTWVADYIAHRRANYSLQVAAGIWLTAIGTAMFTGYRTYQLLLRNRLQLACFDSWDAVWVIVGFALISLGYFFHVLGKTGSDKRRIGIFMVTVTIVVGIGAYILARSHGCGPPLR